MAGTTQAPFLGRRFQPPSKGDSKERSMLVSIVSALRPQLGELAPHPNLGEQGAREPSGAPICSMIRTTINLLFTAVMKRSDEAAFIRVKHKGKKCTQKLDVM